MTIKQTIDEIQKILDRTPYSREEIASLWREEADKDWAPKIILAYSAALKYLRRTGKPEAEFIRGKYLRLLDELKEQYSTHDIIYQRAL